MTERLLASDVKIAPGTWGNVFGCGSRNSSFGGSGVSSMSFSEFLGVCGAGHFGFLGILEIRGPLRVSCVSRS